MGVVWCLACLLRFGLCLVLLRWLCVSGSWHIWVLRGECRDMAESWGFEGAHENPVAVMKNPRNR